MQAAQQQQHKRSAPPDGSSPSASKVPKSEHGSPDDFSNSVKKKLSSATRTGQACDRCKIRKIRCDATRGGCTPCRQNNTECKTTDRITGRATARGYNERLEWENQTLKNKLYEYEQQLKSAGIEPKSSEALGGYGQSPMQPPTWPSGDSNTKGWSGSQSSRHGSIQTYDATEANLLRHLPAFRPGCNGDNYLGVSSDPSKLSSIKGTSLSIFGMEINLSDFISDDEEHPYNPRSYEHFLRVISNREPSVANINPPLTKEHVLQQAELFFQYLNPYTPVLDKQDFHDLVRRWFHEPNYQPSAAEFAIMHGMLAQTTYQFAQRNVSHDKISIALDHYRLALSKFAELIESHTLQDVQALVCIVIQMRNFPKPGPAWIMCQTTIALAVELGLHRSTRAWAEKSPTQDTHEIEMRKRTFWVLYCLSVNLSGKLGRPMPFRMDDIDVEFPDPVEDALLHETNIPAFNRCSFRVGIVVMKLMALFGQMYSSIYSVRPLAPPVYEQEVRRLEQELQQWRSQIPAQLADSSRAENTYQVFAAFLDNWEHEFRLLLHFPAVCRSENAQDHATHLQACLDTSQKMLSAVELLRRLKSLDIPWINLTVYLAAIFTALYVWTERKEQITAVEFHTLSGNMERWLSIMGECGQQLGYGNQLEVRLGGIINQGLGKIGKDLFKRQGEVTNMKRRASHDPRQNQRPSGTETYSVQTFDGGVPAVATSTHDSDATRAAGYLPENPYSTSAQYAYPEPPASSVQAYPPESATYAPSQYDAKPQMSQYQVSDNDLALRAVAAAAQGYSNPDASLAYAAAAQAQQPTQNQNGNVATPWNQWFSHNIPANLAGSQEYLNTAGTLMQLGNRDMQAQPDGTVTQDTANQVAAVQMGSTQPQIQMTDGSMGAPQWPNVIWGGTPMQ